METSNDRPNTQPSLKLSEERVHELVGGPLTPPLLRQRCGEQKAQIMKGKDNHIATHRALFQIVTSLSRNLESNQIYLKIDKIITLR